MEKEKIVEKPLKDVIIEIVGRDGKSINEVFKVLEEKGIKKHRLILTGYLMALRDMGILKERIIKPAKVYSISTKKKRTIYQIIGEKARKINEEESSDICLYTLYKIFNRPIFMRELENSGVGSPKNAKKVVGVERKKAIQTLQDSGITIPRNNSAYIPGEEFEDEFIRIMIELIIDSYNLKNLVNKNVQQMKIDPI